MSTKNSTHRSISSCLRLISAAVLSVLSTCLHIWQHVQDFRPFRIYFHSRSYVLDSFFCSFTLSACPLEIASQNYHASVFGQNGVGHILKCKMKYKSRLQKCLTLCFGSFFYLSRRVRFSVSKLTDKIYFLFAVCQIIQFIVSLA